MNEQPQVTKDIEWHGKNTFRDAEDVARKQAEAECFFIDGNDVAEDKERLDFEGVGDDVLTIGRSRRDIRSRIDDKDIADKDIAEDKERLADPAVEDMTHKNPIFGRLSDAGNQDYNANLIKEITQGSTCQPNPEFWALYGDVLMHSDCCEVRLKIASRYNEKRVTVVKDYGERLEIKGKVEVGVAEAIIEKAKNEWSGNIFIDPKGSRESVVAIWKIAHANKLNITGFTPSPAEMIQISAGESKKRANKARPF